jgi:hypothetical protein
VNAYVTSLRLSPDDRIALKRIAAMRGHRGIAGFIRAALNRELARIGAPLLAPARPAHGPRKARVVNGDLSPVEIEACFQAAKQVIRRSAAEAPVG